MEFPFLKMGLHSSYRPNLEQIISVIEEVRPSAIVLDSVQTAFSETLIHSIGTDKRERAFTLMSVDLTTILIVGA